MNCVLPPLGGLPLQNGTLSAPYNRSGAPSRFSPESSEIQRNPEKSLTPLELQECVVIKKKKKKKKKKRNDSHCFRLLSSLPLLRLPFSLSSFFFLPLLLLLLRLPFPPFPHPSPLSLASCSFLPSFLPSFAPSLFLTHARPRQNALISRGTPSPCARSLATVTVAPAVPQRTEFWGRWNSGAEIRRFLSVISVTSSLPTGWFARKLNY